MVRIWYSVCISEEDFALLTSALHDLATTNELRTLTEGVMEISTDQLSQLKSVWDTWLRLSLRKGPWVEKARQRTNSSDSEREDGLSRYIRAIPKEHRSSTQYFFDTGIFHSTTNATELTRQNPTLTGRGFHRFSVNCEFHYSIPPNVLPFTGWDYKAIKKTCQADSLPEMYTIYLSQILHKTIEKLNSDQVKFRFILCDVRNIEAFLPAELRYDRITTSNLWDCDSPLTVLLSKFQGFLNATNPHAVILTETDNWPRDFMPEIIQELPYIYGINDLCKIALKDTQNPELVDLSGLSSVVEYLNITDKFLMFLRASLLASCTNKELASFKRKKKIPSLKSLVAPLGLQLRDFIRNENTVFPFRWALNCRRVVMLRGYERALEWKLPSDSTVEPTKD